MSSRWKIAGRVWVFGDDVDTDQILPGYAMSKPVEELRKHVMAGSVVPDFASRVQEGDIIVGGFNFGMGSSREQAPVALKTSGVRLVVARSFARIFRRNAVNIGLAVLVADATRLRTGDEIEVDLESAVIRRKSDDLVIRATPLSEVALETLKAGGLVEKVRARLLARGEVRE